MSDFMFQSVNVFWDNANIARTRKGKAHQLGKFVTDTQGTRDAMWSYRQYGYTNYQNIFAPHWGVFTRGIEDNFN
jgi:hypothetical protein